MRIDFEYTRSTDDNMSKRAKWFRALQGLIELGEEVLGKDLRNRLLQERDGQASSIQEEERKALAVLAAVPAELARPRQDHQ